MNFQNSPLSRRQPWWNSTILSYLPIAVFALAGAIATASNGQFVQWLERHTQNFFFERRGAVTPPDNIIILAIDEQSLSLILKHQDDPEKQRLKPMIKTWPWQRSAYAEAIAKLMEAGVKAISIDLLLDLPSGYGAADDRRLQEVLQRYPGKITLAAAYEEFASAEGVTTQLSEPNPIFKKANILLGYANYLPPEADGKARRLSQEYRRQVLPALHLNLSPLPSFTEATLQAAQISYPTPKGDNIFFYGGQNTFPRLSFWNVLDDRNWNSYKAQFKDKIVLIGTTSQSSQFSDFHATPFAEKMPGVEIHANELATLIQGKAIAEAIPLDWMRGLFVLVLTGVAGASLRIFLPKPTSRLFGGLGIAIAWVGVAYLAFTYAYLILPVAVPTMAIALCGLAYFTIGAIADQVEKFHLRNTLERYVAAPIVQEILRQPDDFQAMLKGRKLKAAVLFSDIRGFTTLSYQLPPEQLVEQLNAYLHAMVEVILEAGGTIDKFIGDAIMAEFGFPISQGEKQDAMNAIRAALGMRKALAQLREEFISAGKLPFFNGIGISFGEAIAGDIGSIRRREYGIIGDTVNIASRVESMTKTLRTDILITESLYQLVKDEVEVMDRGEHELKGREENQVKLYTLVSLKGEDTTLYEQAIADLTKYLQKPLH